jgi:outer membrane receptor protein involved in Fe transport
MPYRLALCAFCLAFFLGISLAHAEATYQFDLPAQPLADSLRAIATKVGTNILFDSKDVKGVKAPPLHAELSTSDAIKRVLTGTRLHADSTTEGTIIIRPGPDGSRSAEHSELEEVVVSARRKEELLTTVPASITAYTSDFLQKQNIQNFADYATRIPNLTFQYGQGAELLWSGSRTTTIRGVSGEGTTAYYINDTPVPSTVSPQTLDLDRIEVLKGPQGTLFGASSMGGTLRFITKKPSLEGSSGTIQFQGGGTKEGGFDFESDVLGNVALVPGRLGMDAAFGYSSDSGYSKRAFPDASGNLVVTGDQGRDDTFTASLTLRAKFSDPLEATVAFIGQSTYLHGFPAAYVPLPGYRPVSYTELRDRDVQEYSKDRWGMGSFVLNYSADGLSVVSSTSFFSRRIEEQEDDTEGTNFYFETPPPNGPGVSLGDAAFNTVSIMHQRLFTHETRLAVEDGTILRGLSGTVGVFYQHTLSNTFLPVIPVPAIDAAGLFPDNVGANSATSRGSQTALFSEIYYKLLPKLTLTLGARQYWIDERTDPQWNYGFIFGPDVNIVPATQERESGLVPKAVLSYKVGDEGNIYASASQGFRPGGSNTALPPVICDGDLANLGISKDDTLRYKSDTLWSYEIGAKSLLGNGRMNASVAAFQIDWSHIQQTALLPTCTLSFIANAGKAQIRGGELELTGKPLAETPLSLQLGLGYTDGVLRDPGVLAQAPNSRLSQVPQWTGTISAYYERPISQRVSLFAAADYSYTGSVDVSNGQRGFYQRQPFNFMNGNIGVSFGQQQLLLYGKNLLDKRLNFGDQPSAGFERQQVLPDGSDLRLPRAVVSRPRQLGLQYQVNF